jgi:hypothetical protein
MMEFNSDDKHIDENKIVETDAINTSIRLPMLQSTQVGLTLVLVNFWIGADRQLSTIQNVLSY